MAAIVEGVSADVLSASLFTRFRSRQDHTFAEKVLSGDALPIRRPRRTPEAGRLYNVSASLVRQHQQGIFIWILVPWAFAWRCGGA